jgi:YVTN family beta-propeller protein
LVFTYAQDHAFLRPPDQADEQGDELFQIKHFSPGEMTLDRERGPFYYGDFDPGVTPEGDYMAQAVFSPDGNTIYLTNRYTDRFTAYDWTSMEPVANIPTGDYPSCIAATSQYILVGCQFADHVYIYSALDYVLTDSLPTGEQPCRIHVSPDESFAYVACDIDDVCTVIDLGTMTVSQTISDFTIYLQTLSWSTQSSRNWVKYSDFLVSPDGSYLVAHNGESEVQMFDIATGTLSQSVNITSPRALAFSGDDDCLICAANPNNVATVHQIEIPEFTLGTSVAVTGHNLATNEVVVDVSGAKAYIGTGSNTSTLIRFGTGDYIQFSNTYTAFWLGVTHDHLYAISGQNRFSIIDFENETMTDQYPGLNQSWGAVSPVAYHVFSYDPLLYEGAYFFDISDPDNINYRGSTLAGLEPEGDAPYRLAIDTENNYLVAVNNLSYSCNIIDYFTGDVLEVFDLGEACYDVVVKGNYAVCGGYNNNTVKIIDLTSLELVAEVTTGQRPMELTVHPFEDIVYAANIKSNSISVVLIDGGNSSVITTIPCGIIGVYIPFFGIRSGVEVDPTGQYLLVAASFDDQVKVIDTQTNQIVKSIDVGDFPLSIAFKDDGSIACVTNLFEDSFTLIQLDGANSEIIGTFPSQGQYPVDVDYQSVDDQFWICNYYNDRVAIFNANDGTQEGLVFMNAYGGAWSLEFHNQNEPVYLTAGNDVYNPAIVYGDSVFELPASASHLQLGQLGNGIYAVATIPGPDWLSLVELDFFESVTDAPGESHPLIHLYPNPFSRRLNISSTETIEEIRIIDLTGKMVRYERIGMENFTLEGLAQSKGIYFLHCILASGNEVISKIILK